MRQRARMMGLAALFVLTLGGCAGNAQWDRLEARSSEAIEVIEGNYHESPFDGEIASAEPRRPRGTKKS